MAQIIEQESGMRFEDYIKKYVFQKAGMINTKFINDGDASTIPEYAYRYEKDSLDQSQLMDVHFEDEIVGSGGMYLSLIMLIILKLYVIILL